MTIWRIRNSETLFSDSSSENIRVTKAVWDKTGTYCSYLKQWFQIQKPHQVTSDVPSVLSRHRVSLHTTKMLCVVCNLRTGNNLIWSLFSYLQKLGEFDGFCNFFQYITGNDRCLIIEGRVSTGKKFKIKRGKKNYGKQGNVWAEI